MGLVKPVKHDGNNVIIIEDTENGYVSNYTMTFDEIYEKSLRNELTVFLGFNNASIDGKSDVYRNIPLNSICLENHDTGKSVWYQYSSGDHYINIGFDENGFQVEAEY